MVLQFPGTGSRTPLRCSPCSRFLAMLDDSTLHILDQELASVFSWGRWKEVPMPLYLHTKQLLHAHHMFREWAGHRTSLRQGGMRMRQELVQQMRQHV